MFLPSESMFIGIMIVSEDGIPKLFDLIGLMEHLLILTLGEIGGWRQNGKHKLANIPLIFISIQYDGD